MNLKWLYILFILIININANEVSEELEDLFDDYVLTLNIDNNNFCEKKSLHIMNENYYILSKDQKNCKLKKKLKCESSLEWCADDLKEKEKIKLLEGIINE
jgi:hypothetical protein